MFAVGGVVAKTAFALGVPPAVLAEWRVLFAFAGFVAFVALTRRAELRVRRADLPLFAIFGVFGFGGVQLTYYEAIQRIPIGVALVIEYVAPLLVLVYARLRGRRVGGRLWIAAVLTLVGCYFAVGAYDATLRAVNALGAAIAGLDALLFAGYFVLAERLARRYTSWTLAVYGFGFALLAWAVVRPLWTLPWSSTPEAIWPLVAFVVVAATLAPFAMTLGAVRLMPAARVGIAATSEPFIAAVVAWVGLGESLEPLQLAGGGLVLGGIVLAQSLRPTAGSV